MEGSFLCECVSVCVRAAAAACGSQTRKPQMRRGVEQKKCLKLPVFVFWAHEVGS